MRSANARSVPGRWSRRLLMLKGGKSKTVGRMTSRKRIGVQCGVSSAIGRYSDAAHDFMVKSHVRLNGLRGLMR